MPCITLLLFVTLLAGCTYALPTASSNADTLFQTSTLSALQAGAYDGELTIGQLKQHGDFGLGTFSALDGEMVMVDGALYRVDDRGVVHIVDDAATTPFAAVTFFEPDENEPLPAAFTCSQLQDYLDTHLPLQNVPYALRIAGEFSTLTVRSVPAQQKPYPALADALANQVVFAQQNISGALIGFRLPAYLAGANVAGYHFHFISDDRQVGGHVLDCATESVTVSADDITSIQIGLLPHVAFDPSTDGEAADSGRLAAPVDNRAPSASTATNLAPLKIGVLNPTSGPLATFGQDVNVGIERFFESLGGNINGRPIELIMTDTAGEAEQAQADLPAIAIPLDHPSAPFLESYRYAVQAGATAEWRKMEGVAYDPARNRLYFAMSEVNQGMSDGQGDIDVVANPCGAIYAADLDNAYELGELHALISGGPYDENAPDNPCHSDT
ncbi:MAG: acetolactate decarboxylase [Caldilineaceae bacterium]